MSAIESTAIERMIGAKQIEIDLLKCRIAADAAPIEAACKLTLSEVMARGWTRAMIDEFLGEPEATKRHPKYRGTIVKLYRASLIYAVECTTSFIERRRKAIWRRDRAKPSAGGRA